MLDANIFLFWEVSLPEQGRTFLTKEAHDYLAHLGLPFKK